MVTIDCIYYYFICNGSERGGGMIPKFRVWFSEPSQMITNGLESINLFDETVTMTSGYYDNIADDYISNSIEVDIGNAILMQSTGLFDKNGKEIFEGDIVKRTYLFSGGYGETHTGEIVYDKEYARYVISRPQQCTEPKTEDLGNILSNKSTYEVIGNIYENPELLEVVG